MEKKPLFIAISSPKGGVGKSTLTTVIGSVLHYSRGVNVVIVDCDYPQHSIHRLRQRDMDTAQKNDMLKKTLFRQYKKTGKPFYSIIRSNSLNAIEDYRKYRGSYDDDPEIVLFDLPGTLNSEGVVQTISEMDYIFVPVIADNMVMHSSLQFAEVCMEELVMKNNCNLKGIYLFWNRIDRRERPEIYLRWKAVIANLRLKILKTHIPDTKRYNREPGETNNALFRSTILPPDIRFLKGAGITELIDEITDIINPQ